MRIAARLAVDSIAPERRRAERTAVEIEAWLQTCDFHGRDVVVRDLSERGFCLEAGVRIPPKSLVRLRLPGLGMVLARVVWARRGQLGGEFVNPLPPQRMRAVVGYRASPPA